MTEPIGPRGIRGVFRQRNGWNGSHHLVRVDFGDWQADYPEEEYRDALFLPEFEDLPWKEPQEAVEALNAKSDQST